jgi:hypothetical protein
MENSLEDKLPDLNFAIAASSAQLEQQLEGVHK